MQAAHKAARDTGEFGIAWPAVEAKAVLQVARRSITGRWGAVTCDRDTLRLRRCSDQWIRSTPESKACGKEFLLWVRREGGLRGGDKGFQKPT